MSLTVPLPDGLSLRIEGVGAGDRRPVPRVSGTAAYPTNRLQKGLLLSLDGRDLAEEGVGFGVPVLKRGAQTVFPSSLTAQSRREGPIWEVTTVYRLDLVERLTRRGGGRVEARALYAAKDALAALHRRAPRLRGALTATSSSLRRVFGWETAYEPAGFASEVVVTSSVHADTGVVEVAVHVPDLAAKGVTEVVLMNEQGARHFAEYRDSDDTVLRGHRIGTWDEVRAARAGFVDAVDRVVFWLDQVPGARLHRGRELVGERLAWAGFGYICPPTLGRFTYLLQIARTR